MPFVINPAIIWLILLVIFVIAEATTVSLVSIWFAAGSLIALILATLKVSFPIQIGVFIGVSLILLICTRPFAKKFLDPKITKTNFDRIIGKTCIVEEEINNTKESGSVKVNGIIWTARSSEGEIIPAGKLVQIEKIEGVKVFVTEIKN